MERITVMSHQGMFELSASELEQVAGGLAAPYIPPGATNVKFVSNGPNGVETGWQFTTAAGLSGFVSAQPDEAFDAAP
jgi:hypothetical protein